jgi:hypothetical protein
MVLPNIEDLKTPEELAQIKERIKLLESRLAKIDQGQLDLEGDDADAFEEESLRAGADAYMEYDPDTAQQWTQKAGELKAKRESAKNKPDMLIDDLRATHNAYLNNLSQLYGQGAQKDDSRVINAQRMVDATAEELRKRGLPFGKAEEKKDETIEGDRLSMAREEAKAIMSTAKDVAPKDGVFDNRDDILIKLDDIAEKQGINRKSQAWQDILGLFAKKEETLSKVSTIAQENKKTGFSQGQQQFTAFKDYVPVINASIELQNNPNSFTSRNMGVGQVMKILSGLGVTDSERANTMVSLTDDSYQNQYNTREKQYKESFISKFLDNDKALLTEIAKNLDPNKVVAYLNQNTPKQASTWFYETQGIKQQKATENKPTANAPKRSEYKTTREYLKALKAFKEGK